MKKGQIFYGRLGRMVTLVHVKKSICLYFSVLSCSDFLRVCYPRSKIPGLCDRKSLWRSGSREIWGIGLELLNQVRHTKANYYRK